MSTTFGWLHFTDLHRGMTSQNSWFSHWEQKLFDDLEELHGYTGPWDLVLFTGDLTDRGTAEQFKKVDEFLTQLWDVFHRLQPGHPVGLLAVPGNHDLRRPDPKGAGNEVELLKNWSENKEMWEQFWTEPSGPHKAVKRAFQEYQVWWKNRIGKIPCMEIREGCLPGDFAATFERSGAKIGVLGLNSAFTQLGGGDYGKRLVIDYQQSERACGQSPSKWAREHHLCLLLTHHPQEWLGDEANVHFGLIVDNNIALHLHGHMHETEYRALTGNAGVRRRSWQGVSLFGEEGGKIERRYGYAIGRVELHDKKGTLRLWPRKAMVRKDAWWFGPENELRLDESQRNATPAKRIELHYQIRPMSPQLHPILTHVREQYRERIDKEERDSRTLGRWNDLPIDILYETKARAAELVKQGGVIRATNILDHHEWKAPQFSKKYLNRERVARDKNDLRIERFFVGSVNQFEDAEVQEMIKRNEQDHVVVRRVYVSDRQKQQIVFNRDIAFHETEPECLTEGRYEESSEKRDPSDRRRYLASGEVHTRGCREDAELVFKDLDEYSPRHVARSREVQQEINHMLESWDAYHGEDGDREVGPSPALTRDDLLENIIYRVATDPTDDDSRTCYIMDLGCGNGTHLYLSREICLKLSQKRICEASSSS